MSELSEVPPVVDPVQWRVRSAVDTFEPPTEARPSLVAAPRPARDEETSPARRPRLASWALLVQLPVWGAAAWGYALLRGGSPVVSVALVVIVLAMTLRGRQAWA